MYTGLLANIAIVVLSGFVGFAVISKVPNTQPLLPGMIVSDEPGYYLPGAYGVRT